MSFKWPWSTNGVKNYTPVHQEEEMRSVEREHLISEKEMEKPSNVNNKHRFIVCILFVIAALLAVISLILTFAMNFSIVRKTPSEVELPYVNPIPPLPLELATFGHSDIFTERSNERSDAAWNALAGPTKNEQGFIYIPNAHELGLPPGSMKNGGEMYGISMFHQLHCLGAIRHTFWQLMDGKLDPVEFEAMDGDTTASDFVPNGHGLWHIKHCLNYVRHALQCAGDTTIEVPTLFNGRKIFIGWNTTHQCRNYEAVWDYTVKHS